MDPATIALVVSFLGSSFFSLKGESDKEVALRLRQSQIDLQFKQQLANIQHTVRNTLDHQIVLAASNNIGINNPGFQALQTDVLDKGAKYAANLKLEQDISDFNNEVNIDNLKTSTYANILMGGLNLFTGGLNNGTGMNFKLN